MALFSLSSLVLISFINSIGRYVLREFLKELLFDKYRVFMAIDSVMTQEVRNILITLLQGLQDRFVDEVHNAPLQCYELPAGYDGCQVQRLSDWLIRRCLPCGNVHIRRVNS